MYEYILLWLCFAFRHFFLFFCLTYVGCPVDIAVGICGAYYYMDTRTIYCIYLGKPSTQSDHLFPGGLLLQSGMAIKSRLERLPDCIPTSIYQESLLCPVERKPFFFFTAHIYTTYISISRVLPVSSLGSQFPAA